MNFTTIRLKIALFWLRVFACVLSPLRAQSVRRAWPALRRLYLAAAGQFEWGFYGFSGGLALETKVCESCRKQWPSATLCWHCTSAMRPTNKTRAERRLPSPKLHFVCICECLWRLECMVILGDHGPTSSKWNNVCFLNDLLEGEQECENEMLWNTQRSFAPVLSLCVTVCCKCVITEKLRTFSTQKLLFIWFKLPN